MRSYRGIPVVFNVTPTLIFDGGFDAILGDFVASENWSVAALSAYLRNLTSGYVEIEATRNGTSILREPWRVSAARTPSFATLIKRGKGLPFGSVLSFTGSGLTAVDAYGMTIQLVLER